ncbi:cell division protein ZapA [uncultured Desulfuromonas sp.]|uniref:cell division protein ZapA n=1 Tax=uncultured Desulfuromonas sp. TaxID=181013 RepID=UPI00262B8752|nr:cell division protein ZapA [uncultured Desulfuromonas sp.]
MKHAVQVTILGQTFTLRSGTSAEEAEEVAAFVAQKISEVTAAGKTADTLGVAVLALMNLAGAYLQMQKEGAARDGEPERRLRELLERLDQVCPETAE